MQLEEQQQEAIRQWAAQGVTLSELQNKLRERFGISITYMDLRMLIVDLGVTLQDKSGGERPSAGAALTEPPAEESGLPEEDLKGLPRDAAGGVSVEVDRIMKPGSMVSGRVTFSDGVSAGWMIDPAGRVGLIPDRRGYSPNQEDLLAFQMRLRSVLQRQGF